MHLYLFIYLFKLNGLSPFSLQLQYIKMYVIQQNDLREDSA